MSDFDDFSVPDIGPSGPVDMNDFTTNQYEEINVEPEDNSTLDDETLPEDNSTLDDETLPEDNSTLDDETLPEDNSTLDDETLPEDNSTLDDETLPEDNSTRDDQFIASESNGSYGYDGTGSSTTEDTTLSSQIHSEQIMPSPNSEPLALPEIHGTLPENSENLEEASQNLTDWWENPDVALKYPPLDEISSISDQSLDGGVVDFRENISTNLPYSVADPNQNWFHVGHLFIPIMAIGMMGPKWGRTKPFAKSIQVPSPKLPPEHFSLTLDLVERIGFSSSKLKNVNWEKFFEKVGYCIMEKGGALHTKKAWLKKLAEIEVKEGTERIKLFDKGPNLGDFIVYTVKDGLKLQETEAIVQGWAKGMGWNFAKKLAEESKQGLPLAFLNLMVKHFGNNISASYSCLWKHFKEEL